MVIMVDVAVVQVGFVVDAQKVMTYSVFHGIRTSCVTSQLAVYLSGQTFYPGIFFRVDSAAAPAGGCGIIP